MRTPIRPSTAPLLAFGLPYCDASAVRESGGAATETRITMSEALSLPCVLLFAAAPATHGTLGVGLYVIESEDNRACK